MAKNNRTLVSGPSATPRGKFRRAAAVRRDAERAGHVDDQPAAGIASAAGDDTSGARGTKSMKNNGSRLRYAFDNTMAKGPIAMIGWLAVLSSGVIALATAIVVSLRIRPGDAQGDMTPMEVAWMSLMRTLDPGTMGGDSGWAFRVAMLLVTLGGIFIVSTLIGVVITGMEAKLDQLRKGRSFVMERNHTLILGWSSKIHTIISELTIANENQRKPRIVILADHDKVEMEDEVRDKTPNLRNTKVICRRGNPNDMN